MALNRAQRRAQLKQLGKRFSGFDITKGTLELNINNSEEKISIDLMNFNTIYYITEMVDKFTDLESAYSEDFEAIDAITNESKKQVAMVRVYKKVIDDFSSYIDKIFGDGATVRIFGNSAPMPQVIGEFIEDMAPVVQSISSLMNAETGGNENSIQSILESSKATKYSGGRMGNV